MKEWVAPIQRDNVENLSKCNKNKASVQNTHSDLKQSPIAGYRAKAKEIGLKFDLYLGMFLVS